MDRSREKDASEGIAPMGITALNETVLSNQPESRYECPICLNWLRDPVITTCGHKFCKSCITSWLQNSGHCPIDNINLSIMVDVFPDNYTKREIQEQRMSCPFTSKGCTVKLAPLDLDAHIASCEYNQPEASSQPDIRVPCAFSTVGCKETFDSQEDMNTHLCNDINSHMNPDIRVPCAFSTVGCKETFDSQEDMNTHLCNDINSHMNVSICNISTICLRRTLGFFGHLARREPDSLEKLILVGHVEGRRSRGCTVKLAPLDLDAHIASCEYNQPEASSQPDIRVPCAFSTVGCKDTFDSQEDMNTHLCNDINSHMNVSIRNISRLYGCTVKLAPLDLDCEYNQPQASSQPDIRVPCAFSTVGCKETFDSQEDMNTHLCIDINSHMNYCHFISIKYVTHKHDDVDLCWSRGSRVTERNTRRSILLYHALDLDAHIASCEYNQPEASSQPDIRVPCAFSTVGCKETFDSQEDMNSHLCNDINSHMNLLVNAYSEIKISSDISNAGIDPKEQEAMSLWEAPDKEGNPPPKPLNNTSALIRALYERVVVLEQRNREQDIVIANISKQLNAFAVAKMKQNNEMLLRYCMGNYIWRVDNFKARCEAMMKDHFKMLYSPGFYTSPNGYRFCVRLNISPQNPECFALHVHLMKTENDDCLEWPFNGRISFAMLNQYDPDLTQRDTMMSNSNLIAFRKPTTEICVRGFGYTEYAGVSQVLRNGFVKDDTLIIRVHIKCV
ncbi:zinc finger, c3HC4 type (RING finger) domain-containing protein [Phthorimaea operculella]|nr:zinc finger, c3HC4 type (RING finger) domain-containing protein [Phthorimaea operculella]